MAKWPTIVVGGTFDRLHAGHRRLLYESFSHASEVAIGLSTDALVRREPGKGKGVSRYATRRRGLERYLTGEFGKRAWRVVPLSTPEGRILDPDVNALAVSEETFPAALRANATRVSRGLVPLTLVVVGRVYAADFMPISSRRIRAGAIDPEGRRLTPVEVLLEGQEARNCGPSILGALRGLLLGTTLHPVRTGGDFAVTVTSGTKGTGVSVVDRQGERLEARLSPEESGAGGPGSYEGDLRDAVFAQLLQEAFLPRRLSREGLLPPSFTVRGETPLWRGSGEWTRKLYSPAGVFPYQ